MLPPADTFPCRSSHYLHPDSHLRFPVIGYLAYQRDREAPTEVNMYWATWTIGPVQCEGISLEGSRRPVRQRQNFLHDVLTLINHDRLTHCSTILQSYPTSLATNPSQHPYLLARPSTKTLLTGPDCCTRHLRSDLTNRIRARQTSNLPEEYRITTVVVVFHSHSVSPLFSSSFRSFALAGSREFD
ncbi:hypothetical protein RRG08_030131 [Elysia crispata]|uniref:Uncharacterized protein n=1 Tax=Elysia crispata TaxID=231223 RepID=A0AAE0ZR83_9GAST|nr:hypothetical protein RRG08_030131 [Elysia crispata]